MSATKSEAPVTQIVRAEVIRADGSVCDLGILTAEYANPLKQWYWEHIGQRMAWLRAKKFNFDNARRAK